MDCPACSNKMVEAKATDFGDTYSYCRTCKKELSELQPKIKLEDPSQWAIPSPNVGILMLPYPGIVKVITSNIGACTVNAYVSEHVAPYWSDTCFCCALNWCNGAWRQKLAAPKAGT